MQVFEICLPTFYTTDTPSFLPVLATDLQSIMIYQQEQDLFLVLNFQEARFSIYHPRLLCPLSIFSLASACISQTKVLQRPITGS